MKRGIVVGLALGSVLLAACASRSEGGLPGLAVVREGVFECGSEQCVAALQMCSVYYIEGDPDPNSYEAGCAPIPTECLDMATCDCVLAHWEPSGFGCYDYYQSGGGHCSDEGPGLEVCGKTP